MVEKKTLARPYAKAAFEYACTKNQIDAWSVMLQNAAGMVDDTRVKKIITNPELTPRERADFFVKHKNSFFNKQKLFDEGFCNFINFTASYGRLALLPEILAGFEVFKLKHRQEVDICITSAIVLDDTQKSQLKSALTDKLSRKVNLTYDKCKDLIGGLVIRIGDLVIDSSVQGQLKKMLSNLLH